MITKFVVCWGAINETRIIRETEKYIFLFDGNGIEKKALKSSGNYNYFDSFDAAKNFLVEKQSRAVTVISRRLEAEKGKLRQIQGLKIEDIREHR